jgi:hypothetical protein
MNGEIFSKKTGATRGEKKHLCLYSVAETGYAVHNTHATLYLLHQVRKQQKTGV